jgi:peroxiredoxin
MLKAGDRAPNFTVPTLDGSSIKLSELRGNYVLLDFWATWCGPCVAETPNLKSIYESFGKDPHFMMISLSIDAERETPSKFVNAKGLAWPQAFLGGDWSKNIVAQNYGITAIPQIMLIGPDGKIIVRDLRGSKIKETVATALGK